MKFIRMPIVNNLMWKLVERMAIGRIYPLHPSDDNTLLQQVVKISLQCVKYSKITIVKKGKKVKLKTKLISNCNEEV